MPAGVKRPRGATVGGDLDELHSPDDRAALELVGDLEPEFVQELEASRIDRLTGVDQKRPAMPGRPGAVLDVLVPGDVRPCPGLPDCERDSLDDSNRRRPVRACEGSLSVCGV